MPEHLASFAHPPVIELVLGVQFDPLGLTSGHLGWYWKSTLGDEWPRVADAPRLLDQVEPFGNMMASWPFPNLISFGRAAEAQRLQISNDSRDRMIQVQDTRFIFNWLKGEGEYPRYPQIKTEFDTHLARFTEFARVASLNPLKPNQWEVNYVNHIPAGELWQAPADWPKVIPGLLVRAGDYGGTRFENMSGEWQSEIPERRGRLRINVAFQHKAADQVLALTLTARGPVSEQEGLTHGLDLGRKTIVTAFDQITSVEAKEHWGRQSNGSGTA
ncbi:MAG TPA: TIGR04255 family protein [Pirellulales bacterium]|jgi:uncharacterized protein (TIGR04255 family)|nr:TIGR04255 family protein [Pirellulales bacterium]